MTGWRRAAAAVAAVVMVLASIVAVVVTPPSRPAPADRPARTLFSSSFEAADPSLTWTDTVDTDPAGALRASGVDGAMSSDIGRGPAGSPTAKTLVGFT